MRESEPKTLSAAMRKAMHSETTYSLIKGRAENIIRALDEIRDQDRQTSVKRSPSPARSEVKITLRFDEVIQVGFLHFCF